MDEQVINACLEHRLARLHRQLQTCIDEVISFNGKNQNYCIGIVDMVNSTKITAHLTKEQMCKYYGIFLNSMALVAKEYDAIVIKNIGDSLLYYFSDVAIQRKNSFVKPLECGLAMIHTLDVINEKMRQKLLPPVSCRVSTDYGNVMVAKSVTSPCDDIFGSTINLCAKINHMARPNGMVIGNDLYQIAKSQYGYSFEYLSSYSNGLRCDYPVFAVKRGIAIQIPKVMIIR